MNLVQQANFLEDVPKEQLAQMSQDPNAQFPPFLVLSEIQRRTTNEKNYQAMQQQPTTTVAEEVVNEFMQPQLAQNQPTGLQGGVPQSATPLPDSNISAGLSGAPTAPMQMAASGGLTEYQEGGQSKFGSMMDSIFEVGSDVANWASENPIEAAATGLMFVPGIGWGSSAILRGSGMLYKGLKGVDYAKKAKQTGAFLNPRTSPLFTSPSQTAGKNLLPQTLQSGRAVPVSEVNRLGSLASRRYSPLRTTGTGTGLLTAKTGYDYLSSPADETTEKEDIKKTEPNIGPTYKKLMSQMNSSNTNSSKGLGQGQMDYRDMIRMGMGIMGAKDMSDLGDSVTGVLDAQDKRELMGIQGALTQAQTDQIQAKIESMPKETILAQMKLINDAVESGVIQDMEAAQAQYNALSAKLAELEGQKAPTGSDILSRRKIA